MLNGDYTECPIKAVGKIICSASSFVCENAEKSLALFMVNVQQRVQARDTSGIEE